MIGILVLVFILAIDQHAFTRVLSRPLVACVLFSFVLGDIQKGLLAGVYLETIYLAYEEMDYSKHRASFLLASLAICLFGSISKEGNPFSDQILLTMPMLAIGFGLCITHLIEIINTIWIPLARNKAEKNGKGLSSYHFFAMIIEGMIFVVAGYFLFMNKENIVSFLEIIHQKYPMLIRFIAIFSSLLPTLGIAILMRNIQVKNYMGALLGGIGIGSLLLFVAPMRAAFLIAILLAMALGFYHYRHNTVAITEKKGGSEKWW